MSRRTKRLKLFLLLCVGIFFFILSIRENLRRDVFDFLQSVRIYFTNLNYELFPSRRRPISTLERETELKINLQEPFIRFDEKEWHDFWELIYGVKGKEIPDNPRLPYIKKQLSIQEIEEELQLSYSIFNSYSKQHWEEFWNIIFRKKTSFRRRYER